LVSRELIQDYKNSGGWNNDWALSQKIISDLGLEVDYHVVVDHFQHIFFGEGDHGLITRERWIANEGLLERLALNFSLGIFTGRLPSEADITLRRFARHVHFDLIVGDGDVPNSKPAPDGLLLFQERFAGSKMWYVGDSVDDAAAALAAHVLFIGIADRRNPRHGDLVRLLQERSSIAVLDDINQLESVL
jgi:phosphoglycolate phosphatase-like HAD superfamily hydrolase